MRERSYQFMLEDISITVTKKRMKNMYLRIKKEDGSVLISAPHSMPDERIRSFARERVAWIRKYQEMYQSAAVEREKKPQYTPAEIQERKALLEKKAEELIRKWESVVGVQASGITIRQMKTRWGSCNVKTHHISINLALLDKPEECLEYVVVHELTHILEASHNQIFWGYMTKFYPDWKRVRSYLNSGTAE